MQITPHLIFDFKMQRAVENVDRVEVGKMQPQWGWKLIISSFKCLLYKGWQILLGTGDSPVKKALMVLELTALIALILEEKTDN